VLEIGVGSGRVAVPTALAGITVVGVDASETMLELARRRAAPHDLDLTLVRADMRDLPELGTFPLVTVPFRAFLHLRDDAERLAVLRALRDRLEPGGTLAFDVFHPDRLDIAETQGRWIEREPGIDERADWDLAAQTLTLSVRGSAGSSTMTLSGWPCCAACASGCSRVACSRSTCSTPIASTSRRPTAAGSSASRASASAPTGIRAGSG